MTRLPVGRRWSRNPSPCQNRVGGGERSTSRTNPGRARGWPPTPFLAEVDASAEAHPAVADLLAANGQRSGGAAHRPARLVGGGDDVGAEGPGHVPLPGVLGPDDDTAGRREVGQGGGDTEPERAGADD